MTMSRLSCVSAYNTYIFGRASHFTSRTDLYQCFIPQSSEHSRLGTLNSNFLLPILRAQCYSSKKATVKAPYKRKSNPESQAMKQEKDAFYVVRKGNLVGVYQYFADCEAQPGTSICDPPISVYKGYSLAKGTQEYLSSRGLQNALYTIRAADLKEDLFGTLLPCPIELPPSRVEIDAMGSTNERSNESLESRSMHWSHIREY